MFLHTIGKTIIIRASSTRLPSIGDPLYDEQGRRVGVVIDIIGPVTSPFIVLRGEVRKEYYRRGGRYDRKKGMSRVRLYKDKVR